jgi:AcrR family transcriptional regulator
MRKLLDAGVDVFGRKGYHAARVDDIVKVAKTSHGTFYLYFANKEDLFQALVLDVADELASLTAALGEVTPDDAGRAALRDWIGRFADVYEHYGPVIRTWTEAEVDATEFGKIGADVLGGIADALADKVAPNLGNGVKPDIAGLAVVAMIERFQYFVVTGQVRNSRDEVLDTLAAVTHAGLFGVK